MPNITMLTFPNTCSLCSHALIYIEIIDSDGEVYDVDCDNGFTVVCWSLNT